MMCRRNDNAMTQGGGPATGTMGGGGGPLFPVTGMMCRRNVPARSMLQGGGPLFPMTGTMCRRNPPTCYGMSKYQLKPALKRVIPYAICQSLLIYYTLRLTK